MDPEKTAYKIESDEEINIENKTGEKHIKRRKIFIVLAGVSLILVLFLYLFSANSKGEKLVVSDEDQALSKVRKIYYSRSEASTASCSIFSINQNGENEEVLITMSPSGGECIIEPVAVSLDGEFIYFTFTEIQSLGQSKSIKKKTFKSFMIGRRMNEGDSLFLIDGKAEFFSPDFISLVVSEGVGKYAFGTRKAQGFTYDKSPLSLIDGFEPYNQFSPDGNYVQIISNDGLVYNFDPKTEKIVGANIVCPGILSPDGKKVFGQDNVGTFVADSNGNDKHHLKSIDESSSVLLWSRDGTSLLAVTSGSKEIQILELNPEKTEISKMKTIKKLDFPLKAIW